MAEAFSPASILFQSSGVPYQISTSSIGDVSNISFDLPDNTVYILFLCSGQGGHAMGAVATLSGITVPNSTVTISIANGTTSGTIDALVTCTLSKITFKYTGGLRLTRTTCQFLHT